MSCEIIVKSFNPIDVKIDSYTKENVIDLENSIICALNQKLDRLMLITSGCSVYAYEGNILINDAYNTAGAISNLLSVLGLEVKEISCELKGKTYIVSDKLLSVLRNFGVDYKFNHKLINNRDLTNQIKDIISKHKFNVEVNLKMLDMILNIKQNGVYMELAKQEITTDYKDNKFVSEFKGDIISLSESIKCELDDIFNNVKDCIRGTNSNLKDATASIIAYRAKQMGYFVKEVQKGDKIELELVRCD